MKDVFVVITAHQEGLQNFVSFTLFNQKEIKNDYKVSNKNYPLVKKETHHNGYFSWKPSNF